MKFRFALARHSRESGNPAFDFSFPTQRRILAFTGTTATAKTGFPLSRE
jgi:hypothetical protein